MLSTLRPMATRSTAVRQQPRVMVPTLRLGVRTHASTSRTGLSSEPVRRDRVDSNDLKHSRAYDPRRQAKLDKYLSGWTNDVSSSGPVWNPFTAILAAGAFTVGGLGMFAWLSYGILWGAQGGAFY